jgi:hypothetical protein
VPIYGQEEYPAHLQPCSSLSTIHVAGAKYVNKISKRTLSASSRDFIDERAKAEEANF